MSGLEGFSGGVPFTLLAAARIAHPLAAATCGMSQSCQPATSGLQATATSGDSGGTPL
jgi:hypothetical protein